MTIIDHADLRGQTVELTDPENTQFIACNFGTVDEANQATIITNGYGREFLENCKGVPIMVGD